MLGSIQVFDRCLDCLAFACGVLLALIPIVMMYDVVLRLIGVGASVWTNDFSAIALVYVTFLASPWLLREKGHVYVELMTAMISTKHRTILGRIVNAVCGIVCVYIAYLSIYLVADNYGLYDVSAIETPRWLRFLPLPLGFLLLSVEFLRSMLDGEQHLQVHAGDRNETPTGSVL